MFNNKISVYALDLWGFKEYLTLVGTNPFTILCLTFRQKIS